jgi:TPR repeat protein
LDELQQAADQGDPIAQYNLGVDYYRGDRVERDVAKAAELWRKAAASGHVNASNSMAYLVFYGRGVPRDPAEGLRLWQFAAERGHAESQFHLASAYMAGREVARSYVVAYAWASAAVHYSEAAADLGGGPQIHRDASALLVTVRTALPKDQTPAAEARAREFIAAYGPRE